jgi:hypothetical protein
MLRTALFVFAIATLASALASPAEAQQARQTLQGQRAQWISQYYPWHGAYAYPNFPGYGRPLALVVPPNAGLQTHYGWGVANSRVGKVNHQFGPAFPGYGGRGGAPGQFRMPPAQPSDTTQYGVYYVRGPW